MGGTSRREFLAEMAVSGAAIGSAQRRPNVLFIMTDRHRFDARESRNLLAPQHRMGKSVEQARSLKQVLLNRCEAMKSPDLDAISASAI